MAYDRTIPGAVSPEHTERMRAWAQRKPRVALMGEFSAGKSTLLNFLIEENVIPTRATATEVPPVWFSYGDSGTFWVDAEGDSHPIKNDQIGEVPMSARYVRVFSKAEILEHCDIVDTPGISDPNLAVESWRFAAGVANLVLWCSSATQAWRETERSAWLSLPERLRKHSLLIVTRADKLVAEGDRDKVQRRLARETTGLFRDRVFMATPDAVKAKAELAGGDSSPLWESSGAAALLDRLAERFEAIYAERAQRLRQRLTGEAEPVVPKAVEPEAEAPTPADEAFIGPRPARPSRVVAGGPRRSERLRPEDAEAMLANIRSETPPEEPVAASPAADEDGSGAGDDKNDRAFRNTLILGAPVKATPEKNEAEAPDAAEPETTGLAMDDVPEDAGEPEDFDAMADAAEAAEQTAGSEADEPQEATAQAPDAPAEAEPGTAMWETEEAPEAETDEPRYSWAAAETEAEAEPAEAVSDAEAEQAEGEPSEVDVDEPELVVAADDAVASEADEPAEAVDREAVDQAVEPEPIAEPEMASEAESPAEVVAASAMPGEAESAARIPYLLDAAHFVAGSRPQAAVPPAVQLWRGIVARTELLPVNAQIAAMIDELLMALEAESTLSQAEPALVAAAVEPGTEEAQVADEAGAPEAEESAAEPAEVDEAAEPQAAEEAVEVAEDEESAEPEAAEEVAEVAEYEESAEPEVAEDAAEVAESDEAAWPDVAEDAAELAEDEIANEPEATEEVAEAAEDEGTAEPEVAEDIAEVAEGEGTSESELVEGTAEVAEDEEVAEAEEVDATEAAEDAMAMAEAGEAADPEAAEDVVELVADADAGAEESAEAEGSDDPEANDAEPAETEALADETGEDGESEPETDGHSGWRRLA